MIDALCGDVMREKIMARRGTAQMGLSLWDDAVKTLSDPCLAGNAVSHCFGPLPQSLQPPQLSLAHCRPPRQTSARRLPRCGRERQGKPSSQEPCFRGAPRRRAQPASPRAPSRRRNSRQQLLSALRRPRVTSLHPTQPRQQLPKRTGGSQVPRAASARR